MSEAIAWCGFVGAWLLVLGPLNQAIREVQEEEFERDALALAERTIKAPPPVSLWWLFLVPVYIVLRRRRDRVYKQRIRDVMSPEDFKALAHLRDVAGAWFLVALGASLIAVKDLGVGRSVRAGHTNLLGSARRDAGARRTGGSRSYQAARVRLTTAS